MQEMGGMDGCFDQGSILTFFHYNKRFMVIWVYLLEIYFDKKCQFDP